MSNPDTPGPYWQEPAGVGRRGTQNGPGREDPYGRDGGYGRPDGSANGNRVGNGRPAGNGAPDGNRGREGYGPRGYEPRGYEPRGYEPRGYEHGADERSGSQRSGYGRDSGRHAAGGESGREDGYPAGGRRRAGRGSRGSQIGNDLRSRLGLGNGAREAADAPGSNGTRGQDWAAGDGRRSGRDPGSRPGLRNGGRMASRLGVPGMAAPGPGGPGPGGSRRGTRADALRARLGLRSGPDPASPRALSGGGGYGGGPDGYGSGYGGGSETVGFSGPGGTRAATALREHGTGRFTDSERIPGVRRAGGPADGGDGWDGGPRKRRKGSWWRHWTWRKALAVIAGGFAGLLLLVAAAVVYEYQKTPIPTAVSELALQQSSTVYFSDSKTQVGTFSANGIDRQILTSSQIPSVMKDAIVAAEDRNFYHEGGISITGILRSAYHDLFGNGGLQGGSTLTQEFAKNYYTTIGTSRSISTKIKEIFVSIKLSKAESKDWIMTQYLNTVSFGNNAYGVAAGAQIYFNEPALKLTVAQAAMLAAMVNEPSLFSPDPHAGDGYTALVARWHYVLTNMVRDGALTQQQADAQTFPKVSTVNPLAASWTGFKGYIMSAVLS